MVWRLCSLETNGKPSVMAAPVSIVIPTLNAASKIAPTLACLVAGVNAGIVRELIIVDGGSHDDIARIAADVGARLIISEPGRGTQLRAGANAALGSWIIFLHADTVLDDEWAQSVALHLNNHTDAGYGRLTFDSGGLFAWLVSTGANLRSRFFGLPYGDQGLLISRTLYDDVGGYPDIPLMEDVAIARTLRGKMRGLNMTATTSAQRYQTLGWIKRSCKNLTLLVRFLMGTDPEKLARAYRK